MERRALGKTGITVPRVGFGASGLGHVFEDGAVDAVGAVRAALEAGIDFFDVSPFYGDTLAETNLGLALKELGSPQVTISTKVGRYGPKGGAEIGAKASGHDFRAATVRAGLERSMARLGVERLDVVIMHDVEFAESVDEVIDGALAVLLEYRAAGRIRAIGLSALPLAALTEVIGRAPAGAIDVVLSYCHLNAQDTTLEDAVADGRLPRELGIINASALSMGLLTVAGPPSWHPAGEEIKRACRDAAEAMPDISAVALRYALARFPFVATTLVGMAAPDVVRANVATVEALAEPSAEADAREEQLLGLLAGVKNQSWPSGRFPAPEST